MPGEGIRRQFKPSLYVVKRPLEALDVANREFRKTELQNAVNLNHAVYNKYLDWLRNRGCITITNTDPFKVLIKITRQGRMYLDDLRKVAF